MSIALAGRCRGARPDQVFLTGMSLGYADRLKHYPHKGVCEACTSYAKAHGGVNFAAPPQASQSPPLPSLAFVQPRRWASRRGVAALMPRCACGGAGGSPCGARLRGVCALTLLRSRRLA